MQGMTGGAAATRLLARTKPHPAFHATFPTLWGRRETVR
jgi:hypothetical protein